MLFKPNSGNYPTGVSKFGNKFGKTHPGFNDMYYGFEVSKKISDDGVLGFDPSDPSGKDEDQQSAAEALATPAPAVPEPAAATPAPVVNPTPATAAMPSPVTPAAVDNSKSMTLSPAELDIVSISKTDAEKAILDGKVIVTDSEVLSQLNKQPSLSLFANPYGWSDMDKGFGLDPVALSEKSGVICRFFKMNNQYIGNIYKDNDPTNKGVFICRAATDINNQVVKQTVFENLGARKGFATTWKPIISIDPKNWETGYKSINVGQMVTEKDRTFKAFGICRTLKNGTTDEYHIGRAIVDGTTTHCYLKRGGMQVDLTPDELQKTEIMVRPSSVTDAPSVVLSTVVGPNTVVPVATAVAPVASVPVPATAAVMPVATAAVASVATAPAPVAPAVVPVATAVAPIAAAIAK